MYQFERSSSRVFQIPLRFFFPKLFLEFFKTASLDLPIVFCKAILMHNAPFFIAILRPRFVCFRRYQFARFVFPRSNRIYIVTQGKILSQLHVSDMAKMIKGLISNSRKSVRWSAVPVPCLSWLCLKLRVEAGQRPQRGR